MCLINGLNAKDSVEALHWQPSSEPFVICLLTGSYALHCNKHALHYNHTQIYSKAMDKLYNKPPELLYIYVCVNLKQL